MISVNISASLDNEKIQTFYLQKQGRNNSVINVYLQSRGDITDYSDQFSKFLLVYISERKYVNNILQKYNIKLKYLCGYDYIGFSLYFQNKNIRPVVEIINYFFAFENFEKKKVIKLKRYFEKKIENYSITTRLSIDNLNLQKHMTAGVLNKVNVESLNAYLNIFKTKWRKMIIVGNIDLNILEKYYNGRIVYSSESQKGVFEKKVVLNKDGFHTKVKFFDEAEQQIVFIELPIFVKNSDDLFNALLFKYYVKERLDREIRYNQGLAYIINVNLDISKVSLLKIQVTSTELVEVMRIIENVIIGIKNIDNGTIKRLKKKCIIDFYQELMDYKRLSYFIGNLMLLNYNTFQYDIDNINNCILTLENISFYKIMDDMNPYVKISFLGQFSKEKREEIYSICERIIDHEN